MVKGAGSPNYLDGPESLFVRDNYVYVVNYYDSALSIFKISEKKTDNTPAENDPNSGQNQTGTDGVSVLRQWLRIHNPYSS